MEGYRIVVKEGKNKTFRIYLELDSQYAEGPGIYYYSELSLGNYITQ